MLQNKFDLNYSKSNLVTNLVLAEKIKHVLHEVTFGRENETQEIQQTICLTWVAMTNYSKFLDKTCA